MIQVRPTTLEAILPLRDRYRQAMNAQIVHDAWHRRGFTTLYRLETKAQILGYGAVGGRPGESHDIVKEFYLAPAALADAPALFESFLATAQPRWVEAQTNDPFLAPLLARFGSQPAAQTYLFADSHSTALSASGASLRKVTPEDHTMVFAHSTEPVGEWGLEQQGTLVATGGLFYHYNPPFGDLYMEVAPGHRRRGHASYLLQELKRICYDLGHVPAARCDVGNVGSRAALERAGMRICGQIVRAPIAT